MGRSPPTTTNPHPHPTMHAAPPRVDRYSCALVKTSNSTTPVIKCWGGNSGGQLGLGDAVNRGDAPGTMGDALPAVDLGTGLTPLYVGAGGLHTCALLRQAATGLNVVKCWGVNYAGCGRALGPVRGGRCWGWVIGAGFGGGVGVCVWGGGGGVVG